MTQSEAKAQEAAHAALLEAWGEYLATLPLQERLERLTH